MTSKTMMVLAAGQTLSVQAAVNDYWYPAEGVSDGSFADLSHWQQSATTPCDHIPSAYDAYVRYNGGGTVFCAPSTNNLVRVGGGKLALGPEAGFHGVRLPCGPTPWTENC